jgi:NAD(P)H-hydrate epimerase
MAQFGLPGIVLMENAARHGADVALEMVEDVERPRVLVVCGAGNNAGDGFAVARHVSNAGARVTVAMLTARRDLSGDAAINAEVVSRMGVTCRVLRSGVGASLRELGARADLIVDAILGTGLTRAVSGRFLEAIRAINAMSAKRRVLALDVPSGLDCDEGVPLNEAVRAHTTATFAGLKVGFLTASAAEYLGDVVVCDIGVPAALLAEVGVRLRVGGKGRARYDRSLRRWGDR